MRKLSLLLLLLSACSIEKRGAPGTDPTTDVTLAPAAPGDTVEVIISMPTFAVAGDEVPINVVVRNATDRPIELHLGGREITFNILVMRADSTLVWQRLRDASQQILQLKPLAAGESFTLGDRWNAAEPGNYMVTARLPTDAAPLVAAPVRLLVR
jgi:hypothetical protein